MLMFEASNILKTGERLGVKVKLITEKFWIDPALMRIVVADPIVIMAMDWMRGYPDSVHKNFSTTLGKWSSFWFGDADYHVGIRRGLLNLEYYKGKVNLCRSSHPDAYDLGYTTRLDLLELQNENTSLHIPNSHEEIF